MPPTRTRPPAATWTPIPDTADRYSSGIPDFDRLLGGGFRRGSMALLSFDATTESSDRELLVTPTLLNFLYQSNGVMAVRPIARGIEIASGLTPLRLIFWEDVPSGRLPSEAAIGDAPPFKRL
ncbi:MAG: hypothetical protein L3J73_05705, partial [Thermoplasmata archaeon]|nr:hypothetical protein [Thermoplasmata archaeon]